MIDGDERFRKIYNKAGIIDAVTIEENIKKLAKLPLHHNPGEAWVYSKGLDVFQVDNLFLPTKNVISSI